MKKYIKPAMECRKAMVESLLANSILVNEKEVEGSDALSKGLWDDED